MGDETRPATAAASAIPLDAPRPGSERIETLLSVEHDVDGDLRVDGKKVDDDGLRAAATAAKVVNPDIRAVTKADRDAPHGRVIHVLDVVKQAGIGRIAFGVGTVAR